jgi:hypothetical protein
MGTRADFYVGKGKDAEWLGSIAWDGYRAGIDTAVLQATDEATFREAVSAFAGSRRDWTSPDDGWPWPWDDSGTSDCSYWFFDGEVWDDRNGHYMPCAKAIPDDDYKNTSGLEPIDFPDMSARKNVTFGKRSGLIILGG